MYAFWYEDCHSAGPRFLGLCVGKRLRSYWSGARAYAAGKTSDWYLVFAFPLAAPATNYGTALPASWA